MFCARNLSTFANHLLTKTRNLKCILTFLDASEAAEMTFQPRISIPWLSHLQSHWEDAFLCFTKASLRTFHLLLHSSTMRKKYKVINTTYTLLYYYFYYIIITHIDNDIFSFLSDTLLQEKAFLAWSISTVWGQLLCAHLCTWHAVPLKIGRCQLTFLHQQGTSGKPLLHFFGTSGNFQTAWVQ